MAIKKFLISGVAALTLASVAIVPSAAFAQASPGANSNTGAIVGAGLGGVAAGAFVGSACGGLCKTQIDNRLRDRVLKQKLGLKAGKAPKYSKARKYNWNLALAQ